MDELAMPRAARTIEQLGIPAALVQDLALRRALYEGRSSTLRLSSGLGLSLAIITTVVEELRDLRHIDLLGLEGRDYIFELTEQGRDTARERMELCRYAGIAPVSLKEYNATILRQQAPPPVTHESMRHAFSDLVISDRMIDELGPALLTEGAMFLYGPPGTGKTSVAERLIRTHADPVFVPRARRGRQPDHHRVRPGGARTAQRAAPRPRSPLGALPAPEHRRRRRAPAEHDGPHLRIGRRHLPRTDPDAGQQRPARHRRLRPPDDHPRGAPQPLDRAPRPPPRLPVAQLRRPLRHPLRRQGRLLDQPRSRHPRRRGVLPPHPEQDPRVVDQRRRVRRGAVPLGGRGRHHDRAGCQPATSARSAATSATATCARTCPRRSARSSGPCARTTGRRWCSTTPRVDRVASIYFTRAGEIRATMAEATLADPPSSST